MYNQIYNFCKVRNKGNCFENGVEPTPRVKFLIDLLEKEGIEYELDVFQEEYTRPKFNFPGIKPFSFHGDEFQEEDSEPTPINNYFNIIMKGTSNKMIVAHHDVNNHTTDNANDNSASVINVIAAKKLRPDINAVLLDGEEFGGIGSKRLSEQIKQNKFGSIEWVLNLELSGKGGKYFFIGDYPGKLTDKIVSIFNCPIVRTPFNDSVIFRRFGIDSVVINPLPPLPEGQLSQVQFPDGTYLDFKLLYNCHSPKDTVDTISTADMKEFVEDVVLKIIQ
jgi:hypothetical protein